MKSTSKKIFFTTASLLLLILFTSCAKKINFSTSSVVPAARGTVKVKKDNNHNYVIKIQLNGLAEVKRLQPPKLTYVVWMESDQQVAKNIGQINSSSSMLSKTLKASFETVTPLKPTKIFITAEDDAATQYPGDMVVISTERF